MIKGIKLFLSIKFDKFKAFRKALVESLIQKALNPDGKPLFTKFDKNALMSEADPKVLIRVCSELNGAIADYEAVEKN